jgi:hypothetical protein
MCGKDVGDEDAGYNGNRALNSLIPIRVWAGTKNSHPVGFLQ